MGMCDPGYQILRSLSFLGCKSKDNTPQSCDEWMMSVSILSYRDEGIVSYMVCASAAAGRRANKNTDLQEGVRVSKKVYFFWGVVS